jgi:hypothetical protein
MNRRSFIKQILITATSAGIFTPRIIKPHWKILTPQPEIALTGITGSANGYDFEFLSFRNNTPITWIQHLPKRTHPVGVIPLPLPQSAIEAAVCAYKNQFNQTPRFIGTRILKQKCP